MTQPQNNMLDMNPSTARMLCILALKYKNSEFWTKDRLANHFSVSKITIYNDMNKARTFGVSLVKAGRLLRLDGWGAFSKKWILDNQEMLEDLSKTLS